MQIRILKRVLVGLNALALLVVILVLVATRVDGSIRTGPTSQVTMGVAPSWPTCMTAGPPGRERAVHADRR